MKMKFFTHALTCFGIMASMNFAIAMTTSIPESSTPGDEVIVYTWPRICPVSVDYKIKVNGIDLPAYYTSGGSFAAFESKEVVNIEIITRRPAGEVVIHPLRYNITAEKEGNIIRFEMPSASKLLVEIAGMEQLFIYSNSPDESKPDPETPGLRYFKAGQVYETGLLELKDNESIYIEAGAVVRGAIHATSANNVKVGGRGVLDGGYYKNIRNSPRFMLFADCRNVLIEDVILIEPQSWMITLYISDSVRISNVKQLGEGSGTDGVDICGTNNVLIENCMFRNGDDCIVVKSFKRDRYPEPVQNKLTGVSNVLVTGCAVQANNGQAFEIGHELTVGPIENIVFTDCDVMGVHGQGGVFGIHNTDKAEIRNIVYEDIRVDHFYNKLVDFRIIESRWSDDEEHGMAENILLKNIDVKISIFNPGYSISLIGGFDKDHKIKNVVFDNFRLNGKKVMNADELDLYIKQAENVIFK